jgi:hypothetical protein
METESAMKRIPKRILFCAFIPAVFALACESDEGVSNDSSLEANEGDFVKTLDNKGDASIEAIILDFEFAGFFQTDSRFRAESDIDEQLLYTIGHLNGERSVGRLDKVELIDVEVTETDAGSFRVDYRARMPVAWNRGNELPASYTFQLPGDLSREGLQRFTDAYNHDCVDYGAHDVTTSSMWYYYRPKAYRCDLDAKDVAEFDAAVSVSDMNTSGKYPEYDKIWEDDVLKVVAVFGKANEGATSPSDAGISAYNSFVQQIGRELAAYDVQTEPAAFEPSPGLDAPDITFRADLEDGQSVEVVALLVENVRTAGPSFDARYESLSGRADFIAYFGHSGLGANIRALAQKGKWLEDQYVLVFMNGCDTYTYVDQSLAEAHAAVNPNQTSDYQYIDLLMNAMPAYFRSNANNAMVVVRALLDDAEPASFEQIFTGIDSQQVVIVSGEADNTFVPGPPVEEAVDAWAGLDESGEIGRGEEVHYETPGLSKGTYLFEMEGDNDADLYIRMGEKPTEERWDCRPFRAGTAERCEVELPADAKIHVVVRGWASASRYRLAGRRL